jgi:hypothetical protein
MGKKKWRMARAVCAVCGRTVVLKVDSHLASHNNTDGRHCSASGSRQIAEKVRGRKGYGRADSNSIRNEASGGLPGLGRRR